MKRLKDAIKKVKEKTPDMVMGAINSTLKDIDRLISVTSSKGKKLQVAIKKSKNFDAYETLVGDFVREMQQLLTDLK